MCSPVFGICSIVSAWYVVQRANQNDFGEKMFYAHWLHFNAPQRH
ncbi:hypothetical protein ARMA_2357 [Ardenticatena maritima]|uniref:Uncharacterized protein n=1 Tax=Ardenticatena maritima TaxID=872965 RepID=A0A0M8K8E8_9CHLR|nr:hypothetical protein ARMA_2357 [Ardenticatena maritima]